MASTKATTPTKTVALAIGGIALAVCAAINLFCTFTPMADLGTKIDAQLRKEMAAPQPQIAAFNTLKAQQEKALLKRPSDPYGWFRLSYLRSATGESRKASFAALRESDLVSPYEAEQMPERALVWRSFHDVESKEQQSYQDELWQKAFYQQNMPTWDLAVREHIVNEVKDALVRSGDKDLIEGWKGKMSDAGMPAN